MTTVNKLISAVKCELLCCVLSNAYRFDYQTTKCYIPLHIGSVGGLNKYITQRTTSNSHLTAEINLFTVVMTCGHPEA